MAKVEVLVEFERWSRVCVKGDIIIECPEDMDPQEFIDNHARDMAEEALLQGEIDCWEPIEETREYESVHKVTEEILETGKTNENMDT